LDIKRNLGKQKRKNERVVINYRKKS